MAPNRLIITREEVARHLAVPLRLLMRYEQRGLIHAVEVDGTEGYEPRELRRIWSVVSLHREAGINLAGIEAILRLKEQMEVKLTFYKNEPIDIELPNTVELKVVQAEAAVRGDTATGVTKKVTVETGALVEVPQFVNEGDTIRVDTRTGTYVTRV